MRYPITPVAKPRMTQRDKWAKRPIVEQYFKFKDIIKSYKVHLPEMYAHVIFVLPMPKSWSDKKKSEMCYQPHQQRPDVDNLFKALADAIYIDDSHIADVRISKEWGYEGAIIIK